MKILFHILPFFICLSLLIPTAFAEEVPPENSLLIYTPAFLWLIVLWRLFLALPGILRGAVGLAGNMERVSEHFHHEED